MFSFNHQYRSPRLQWHCLQWHPAFSDTFGMSRMIGLIVNYICLQWQSGYSDTFPLSRGCHCKRGDLYRLQTYWLAVTSQYVTLVTVTQYKAVWLQWHLFDYLNGLSLRKPCLDTVTWLEPSGYIDSFWPSWGCHYMQVGLYPSCAQDAPQEMEGK